eukprot:SAG22_NODE_7079_length_779_cov_0.847059_1_plen_210_part_10
MDFTAALAAAAGVADHSKAPQPACKRPREADTSDANRGGAHKPYQRQYKPEPPLSAYSGNNVHPQRQHTYSGYQPQQHSYGGYQGQSSGHNSAAGGGYQAQAQSGYGNRYGVGGYPGQQEQKYQQQPQYGAPPPGLGHAPPPGLGHPPPQQAHQQHGGYSNPSAAARPSIHSYASRLAYGSGLAQRPNEPNQHASVAGERRGHGGAGYSD